jgi:hypothetical protein
MVSINAILNEERRSAHILHPSLRLFPIHSFACLPLTCHHNNQFTQDFAHPPLFASREAGGPEKTAPARTPMDLFMMSWHRKET